MGLTKQDYIPSKSGEKQNCRQMKNPDGYRVEILNPTGLRAGVE